MDDDNPRSDGKQAVNRRQYLSGIGIVAVGTLLASGASGDDGGETADDGTPEPTLSELLERNRQHRDSLEEESFEGLRDGQQPAVVSVCCSDSRVSQEGMWNVDELGWLFASSNIGNRVWERCGDEFVAGSVAYPIHNTGTRTAVIVGHTGCGAVTAAYEAATAGALPSQPGIRTDVEALLPVIRGGLEDSTVPTEGDRTDAINALVEYNVHRQVEFLRERGDLPTGTDVYGFVYDFHGVYGGDDGTTYLVNVNGKRAPSIARDEAAEDAVERAVTLLRGE